MNDRVSETESPSASKRHISSETLALLIIDALIDGGIVQQDQLKKAIEIAVEEIDARKAAGDY